MNKHVCSSASGGQTAATTEWHAAICVALGHVLSEAYGIDQALDLLSKAQSAAGASEVTASYPMMDQVFKYLIEGARK